MTAPQDPYSYPGEPVRRQGMQVFSIIAIVCGILAVFVLPILLGPIGIVLAIVGRYRTEPLWKVGLAVAIAGMLLGFLLGYIVLSNNS